MRRYVVVTAAVLAVLAACGAPTPPTPPDAVFAVAAGAPVCVDRPPVEVVFGMGLTPKGAPLGTAEPTLFARCTTKTERVRGRGEWSVRVEEHADGDIAPLAAALRLPDEDSGGSCSAVATGVPELYAADATGRALLVRWPIGVCGQPRAEVEAALARLTWRPAVRHRLKQVRTEAAIDSGCEERMKNMAAVEGFRPDRSGIGSPGSSAVPPVVRACTYTIDERGDTPVGQYVSGGTTTVAIWRAVILALRSAPSAQPGCTTEGRRFTVVDAAPYGSLYVELDGCRRVLLPEGDVRVATPRVLQELARV